MFPSSGNKLAFPQVEFGRGRGIVDVMSVEEIKKGIMSLSKVELG